MEGLRETTEYQENWPLNQDLNLKPPTRYDAGMITNLAMTFGDVFVMMV
jgi:hypothetical protein